MSAIIRQHDADIAVEKLRAVVIFRDQQQATGVPGLAGRHTRLTAQRMLEGGIERAGAGRTAAQGSQHTQLQGLLEQVRFISPDLQPQVSSTQVVPASEANPESSSASQAAAESSWFDRAYDTTAQWAGQAYDALSSDIGGLIKVEKLSNPDLGIIPVDQVQLIRNNLKQDVRIAQDAMLKQEEGVWKTSLQSVLDNVLRYYDPQDERMETLVTLIKQLQDLSVKPELPELKFTKEAIEQTSRELKTPSPVQY